MVERPGEQPRRSHCRSVVVTSCEPRNATPQINFERKEKEKEVKRENNARMKEDKNVNISAEGDRSLEAAEVVMLLAGAVLRCSRRRGRGGHSF